MTTPLRLVAFAAALAVTFGAAAGLGSAVGPIGPAAADRDAAEHETTQQTTQQMTQQVDEHPDQPSTSGHR